MKQVIRGHPELKYLVGMDVDSLAHDIAQPRLDAVLNAGVKAITVLRNFRDVKSVLREIAELHLLGVDAILMDLGMSSMQVHSTTLWTILREDSVCLVMDPLICGWILRKMDLKVKAATSLNSNAKKKANLFAEKKERIRLPTYNDDLGGKKYHISEFLSQPSGIAAVLNTKALQSFESLDANTYRCELPKLQFLNFEAAPLLDLRVTSTDEDCLVEMLSCKFEGSEVVKEQNDHFSAFMRNQMTWGGAGAESFLEVDVKLNLTLEISVCRSTHNHLP
eukprot:XP_014625483.1 uncharacterized protein LOC100813897 isoform X4 [Glycine max]